MKTKTWLIALPFLWGAGAAMGQEASTEPEGSQIQTPGEERALEDAQVQEEAAVQEKIQDRESKKMTTNADQVDAKKKAPARRRQGADMRHCLDKKDPKAIIRCAEPGRKP